MNQHYWAFITNLCCKNCVFKPKSISLPNCAKCGTKIKLKYPIISNPLFAKFSAILEDLVENFFLQTLKPCDSGPKTGKNGYFWTNLLPKSNFLSQND